MCVSGFSLTYFLLSKENKTCPVIMILIVSIITAEEIEVNTMVEIRLLICLGVSMNLGASFLENLKCNLYKSVSEW